MFHAVSMRTQRGALLKMKTINWWLIGALVLTIILTCGVIYLPFFTKMFEFTAVSFKEFCIAIGLAFLVIPVLEVFKWIFRVTGKK